MKIVSVVVCAALLFGSSAALGDTTANYSSKSKDIPLSMTVEVADNGNVRYQMSTGRMYGLVVNGEDYFVTVDAKGPVVDRASDVVTAQAEAMKALKMPVFSDDNTDSGPPLVSLGTVTINSRVGQAFGYKPDKQGSKALTVIVVNPNPDKAKVSSRRMTNSEKDKMLAAPAVVISHDPDLAQLGKAMSRQFSTSLTMLTRMIGSTPGMVTQMDKLLQSGAPLLFGGMELKSVNHEPIDPSRFALPAQPETLDQIRTRMKPLPPPPTSH
jgi:hypothetical protein